MSTSSLADKTEAYSDWNEWNPNDYISEYYSEVIPDCRFAMQWLLESLADVPPVEYALEFGCGPIPVFTFPLSSRAKEIHLAEYLEVNRNELRKWVNNDPDPPTGSISPRDAAFAGQPTSHRTAGARQRESHTCPHH